MSKIEHVFKGTSRAVNTLLFVVLLFFVLTEFRTFLYPIALGILFAFLLFPVANFFEKKGVTRILANLIAIILGVGIIYAVMFFIYRRLGVFIEDIPTMKGQALANVETIVHYLEHRFGIVIENKRNVSEGVTAMLDNWQFNISNTLEGTAQTLFTIGIMPVYIFMFLFYRNKFRRFFLMLIPENSRKLGIGIMNDLSHVTSKYMVGIFMVVLILCVLNSLGLYIIGVRYAILLGIIAAVCNFIPYFGTIIGYLFPFTVALLTMDHPKYALSVIGLFVIIQFTENNILTPNIVGGQLRINAMVIILGVLLGGIIWGVPGMFVVVPIAGMMRLIFDKVDGLRPYGFLLSDRGTELHAMSVGKVRKFFGFSKAAKARYEKTDRAEDE